MISPDVPREQATNKRLCKNTKPYERITRAAARLAALDEGEVLLEVFRDADFWAPGGARSPVPEFEELAFRLRFVIEGIAAKHDLRTLFRDVQRVRVVAAPSRECERKERDSDRQLEPEEIDIEFFSWPYDQWPWPIEFYQPSWEGEVEENAAFQPYPSLVLGTWRLGDAFPVSVETKMTADDGSLQRAWGITPGWYTAHLRLCIAPVGKDLAATPALRVHLAATLSPLHLAISNAQGDEKPTVTFPLFDAESPADGFYQLRSGNSKIIGRSGATKQDLACEIRIKEPVPEPLKRYFEDLDRLVLDSEPGNWSQASSPGLRFLPITPAVCEDWFGFRVDENRYNVAERSIAERALGAAVAESVPWEAAYGPLDGSTLAGALDSWLCEPAKGLDLLLEAQAQRLKAAFDRIRRTASERRAAGWARVQERWMSPSSQTDE